MLAVEFSKPCPRAAHLKNWLRKSHRNSTLHARPNSRQNGGEYERTTAVALNGYIGPTTVGYIGRLDEQLKDMGYAPPLQITQCAGGTISVKKAREAPLLTLDSGPVSGVTGSLYLGQLMGFENIITTDLGGTSFDVGVIHRARPVVSYRSLVHQYEYFLPKVDVQTLGTGRR